MLKGKIFVGLISTVLVFCFFISFKKKQLNSQLLIKHRAGALLLKGVQDEVVDPGVVKRLLMKKGIYFGDYLSNDEVALLPPRPPNYLIEVNRYFNLYSIPAWYHHTEYKRRGQFDFTGPDEVADFAVAHGAKIQAHNMIWNIGIPEWLKNGKFTPDELRDILKTHIQTVIRHYRDKYPGAVISWDIINESMSDSEHIDPTICYPNGLRKDLPIWNVIHKQGSTDNTDYIQLAFEWAHEADPNVKLYWNEYGAEKTGFKMDRWFKIVKQLKDKGVPINGVGFQSHLTISYDYPLDELRQNMDRFAAIGLECQVTEMDVLMSGAAVSYPPFRAARLHTLTSNTLTATDLDKQAKIYKGVINACINAKNCKALILFGAWDPGTWADFTYKDKQGRSIGPFYPNILDGKLKPKQTFKALIDGAKANIHE